MTASRTKHQTKGSVTRSTTDKDALRGELRDAREHLKARLAVSGLSHSAHATTASLTPYTFSAPLDKEDLRQLVKVTVKLKDKGFLDDEDVTRILTAGCAEYAHGSVLQQLTHELDNVFVSIVSDLHAAAIQVIAAGDQNDFGRSRRKQR